MLSITRESPDNVIIYLVASFGNTDLAAPKVGAK